MSPSNRSSKRHKQPHLWLIKVSGVIVPRRLRADWKQEWEAELRHREELLADWARLNWRTKLDLFWRSLGAFWDALWLQQLRWEDEMFQDLRYGVRMLLKKPGFTLIAAFTLTLGIGASVAVFSVVNAILLRALPYEAPDRLVMLWEKTAQEDLPVSYLNFVDWRDQNQVCSQMAAFRYDTFNLTGAGEAERLESMTVSAGFLSTLGIRPVHGRDFLPEEDSPGGAPIVILSHGLWQRRFGADQSIIGQQITLNRISHTVVGVTPAAFRFGEGGEVLVPLSSMADRFRQRGNDPGVFVVARLKPNVTPERGRAEMDAIMSRLVQQYPEVLAGRQFAMQALYDYTVGDIRPTLLVLLGAVGFVLLIACTNVANLLLARSSGRQKEVAIRAALGASRGRLIRQFLTESVLLSLAGGLLGLLLAYLVTPLLTAFSSGNLPRMGEIGIDTRVLGFTLLLSLLTGIVYGLFPAWQASHTDLNASLKEATRGSTGKRSHARNVLVAAEVALALALLIGGGLMIRSFRNLQKVEIGFEARNLLTMQIGLSANRDEGNKVAAFLDQLQQQVRGLPGVRAVAFSNGLPFRTANQLPLEVEGRPVDKPGQNPNAVMYVASPDYFQVMKIRLVRGRTFSAEDIKDHPRVVVIDDVLAQKYFPGEDPIGKRLSLAIPSPEPQPRLEIVGIVEHVKNFGLDGRSPVQPQFYASLNQIPDRTLPSFVRRLNVVVRTDADPLSLAASVRRQVMSLDQDQPVFSVRTMEQMIAETIAAQQFSMLLLALFAGVALVLAAVGIYGVMAYSVSQRTHEIGIRMALGAEPRAVLKLVIGQGARLALAGVAAGLLASFGLTRLMQKLLFGVSATDPLTFSCVALLLMSIALLACYLPARRAAKVDPLVALRHE